LNDEELRVRTLLDDLADACSTIGELITADPTTIALGTRLSEDKAKMLMIPGLDVIQIEQLERIGIAGK